jgi:hypothetical protein
VGTLKTYKNIKKNALAQHTRSTAAAEYKTSGSEIGSSRTLDCTARFDCGQYLSVRGTSAMASYAASNAAQASVRSKMPPFVPAVAARAPSKLDVRLGQDAVVLASNDSFDAARPRIDSTGLGRPRIDSSVDLGNKLDPPTPDSSSGRKNRRPRAKSNLEFDSDQEGSSSADTDRKSEHASASASASVSASASASGVLVAEPPTRRVEQHKLYRQPAPMLRPTRPLPHQRKRLAPGSRKRGAGEELHTNAEHGAR